MKYAKYILFLVTLIFASCTIEEPEQGKGSKIQFVGRAVPFNEHDVDTRAQMTDEEAAIKTLDYLIFVYIGNGNKKTDFDNWACVFYRHSENSMEMINKEEDFPNFYDKGNHKFIDDAGFDECYVAIVANYPKLYKTIKDMYTSAQNAPDNIKDYIDDAIEYSNTGDGTYLKLSEVLVMTEDVNEIFEVPSTGLPRLGNYTEEGSTEEDRNYVNLNNLTPGKPYTVNLKSLYAKMVFDISVDPNQESVRPEVDGVVNNDNTFSLTGYTVYNVPKEIDFDPTTNVVGEEGKLTREIQGQGITNRGFTFYLPERKFTPSRYTADNYPYPFRKNDGTIRPEDLKLRQRYKPELVEKDENPETKNTDATYVRFTGDFINHQGHSFEVSYDIYVGSDNYGNFDVVRNTQYNNIITIRGINNSSDQSHNPNAVSIDHRVNVTRSAPVIVSFRRETFLDSHFEVRPIRIRAKGNTTQNQAVKLEVKYNVSDPANNTPAARWIGLERSYGNGSASNAGTTYCTGSGDYGPSSAGKRKYFTTDLTYGTLNKSLTDATKGELLYSDSDGADKAGFSKDGGQTVIVPVHNNPVHGNVASSILGECVWLYVDECDEEAEASTTSGAVRSATIRVTYGSIVNGNFQADSDGSFDDYVINQHLLYKIDKDQEGHSIGPYYIEYEEEYLYNFDAEDNFNNNQTFDNGMRWGLEAEEISDSSRAFFVNANFEFVENTIIPRIGIYYDFYLPRDITSNMDDADSWPFAGFKFTKDIVNTKDIPLLPLDQQPESAVQYCYSRNKVILNDNGNIASVNYKWYMPAIDELEEIMAAAYSEFTDFQAKYYWSSQPAFFRNYGVYYSFLVDATRGDYFVDNPNRARATKVEYLGNNQYSPPVSSAMDGYNELLEVYGGRFGIGSNYKSPIAIGNQDSYNFQPSFSTLRSFSFTIPNIRVSYLNHPGNKLRTAECRVRAVRRMPATTN